MQQTTHVVWPSGRHYPMTGFIERLDQLTVQSDRPVKAFHATDFKKGPYQTHNRSHLHLLTLSWVIYLLLNTASQNCFDKAWAQIKTSIIHNGRPWSSTLLKYSALDLAYLVKWNQWNNPKSTNSTHPAIPQVFESWHTGMYLTMSASEGYSCDKNECWESGWDSGWVIRLKSETTYVCVISSKTLQFLNYNISHPCPS